MLQHRTCALSVESTGGEVGIYIQWRRGVHLALALEDCGLKLVYQAETQECILP